MYVCVYRSRNALKQDEYFVRRVFFALLRLSNKYSVGVIIIENPLWPNSMIDEMEWRIYVAAQSGVLMQHTNFACAVIIMEHIRNTPKFSHQHTFMKNFLVGLLLCAFARMCFGKIYGFFGSLTCSLCHSVLYSVVYLYIIL